MSSSSWAFQLEQKWNYKFEKEIVLTCLDEYTCSDFCENENSCIKQERYCRDCVGTSLYIQNIYTQMGRIYVNTGEEVLKQDFLEFLEKDQFASFSAKSVYGQIGVYNDAKNQERFRSLCPFKESNYPVVFFNLKEVPRKLDKVQYVTCNTNQGVKVFKMSDEGIIINNDAIESP
jgi:hypothetical protein